MSEFTLKTAIWRDEPEPDNPFAAARSFVHGYDLFGDLLPRASWFDYLLTLFVGEKPTPAASATLERLAIILANPGPRDLSVRAAMNGGVGGSVQASSLIAALAVGAGQYGGAQEVFALVSGWQRFGQQLDQWLDFLQNPNQDYVEDIWSPFEFAPGFDPHGVSCTTPVKQSLALLAELSPGTGLAWLQAQRTKLEAEIGKPLSLVAVVSAAFHDLGLNPQQANMLYLILRLPGAAVHAMEQEQLGWKVFPAYGKGIHLSDDPSQDTTT